MSNEEEKRCPLCAEEMDWTDQQLRPCKCGYQVCVWCWHQIMGMAEKDENEGRCPACRTPYDKEKVVGVETKFERVVANNRKHKPPKAKPKSNEVKDLTNVRVIQRKMAYVIGLPVSLADEDLLQRREYFGQYGKVTKVSLSRTAGGAVQQFTNDTCSVYITYSKEEEAIRCIQSVHGFELEGRFLRASFGTAKYCHAWLRNTPCNNPACLYLHSVGAEEDSFGKDEVAAVHTRTRVQQVVGATHDMQRRAGNALPPPIDEHLLNSRASTNIPHVKSDLNDVALSTVTYSGHLVSLPSLQDKDGGVRPPDKMTSFVDIVGRPSSSGPEKDGDVSEEDGRIVKTQSELSSSSIYEDNQLDEPLQANAVQCNISTSNHLVNGLHRNKEFKEPFREHSNLLALYGDDKIQHDPNSFVREDILSLDNQRLKDSQAAFFRPSYFPKFLEDSSNHAWQHRDSRGLNDCSAVHSTARDHVGDASIQFEYANPTPNDGYNDGKFQRSAKSDRIYRGSNSFSNEEIVEHLRRLDDDDEGLINNSENPGLDAVKSNIISNLMSLDLDACDESSAASHSLVGSFDEANGRQGSWNFQNSVQPGFSYLRPEGPVSQVMNSESSFSNIGQELLKNGRQDPSDNKDQFFSKSHFNVPGSRNPTPPGFSLSSREPPPGFGFPGCERSDQIFRATSGSHLVNNNTCMPNHHYRTPSTGNSSSTSEVDLIDPAIMHVTRGKQSLDVNSGYPPQTQPSSIEEQARLWLLMQQQSSASPYLQQQTSLPQEPIYSVDRLPSWADTYANSSRLMNQQNPMSNSSSYGQLSQQQNFGNGDVSNGGYYQPGFNEVQRRSGAAITEIERLGLNNYLPGYGDLMLQMPGSGDVYNRLFGR